MADDTSQCGEGKVAQAYHHGSLREALIDAAYEQICEQGIEKLSIAKMCKTLGVSSAAPYRHFEDRDALVGEVSARGFRALAEATREARDAHPKGSIEGLVALGQAYVRFVASNPEMFHVMWGMTREKLHSEVAFNEGRKAFETLLETVRDIQEARGLTHLDTRSLALPLWSGVHGLATLHVGEKLEVAEGLDVSKTVEMSTRAFLAGVETLTSAAEGAPLGDLDAAVADQRA